MKFILFTTQTCAFCPQLKNYLNSKSVKYETIDITNDRETSLELQKKYRALTVPVLVREDGEFMVGINMSKLASLL